MGLTGRDLNILGDIYRVKTLTLNQIARIHFRTFPYAKKRMNILYNEGYLHKKPLIKDQGGKRGVCYYISEKGLDAIEVVSTVPAMRMVDGTQQPYRVNINEIFVSIATSGWPNWIWLDSREVKSEFKLNRSLKISGAIQEVKTSENELESMPTYGVYFIPNDSAEKYVIEVKREIARNSDSSLLNKYIIFFEGDKEGKTNKNYINFGTDKLGAFSLMKLPYKLGLKLIPLLGPNGEGVNLITKYLLDTLPVKSDKITTFTDQKIIYNQEEYYFVELLTNDLAKRYYLQQYTQGEADRNVLALVFEHQLQEYKDAFRNCPNIHICPVNPKVIYILSKETEDKIV